MSINQFRKYNFLCFNVARILFLTFEVHFDFNTKFLVALIYAKAWRLLIIIRRFQWQTITRYKPKFVALHFQESGGKDSGEESLVNVKEFVR